MNKRKTQKPLLLVIGCIISLFLGIGGYSNYSDSSVTPDTILDTSFTEQETIKETIKEISSDFVSMDDVPAYSGEAYVVINDNEPSFAKEDYTTVSFETYSDLDSLGRCGVAYANIGTDLMPTEDRDSISQIKPSGWQSVKYENVDGKYLYNRCHLIGFQLTGENANAKNLITGTRYLNIQGMLPFENMVTDYIKETDNHVLYRVTPVFEGDNLVADGVFMEAFSVEDQGEGICFFVFCYNVQPGIVIDYADGSSSLDFSSDTDKEDTYIINTNNKKFHKPTCSSVSQTSEKNKQTYTGSRSDLVAQGYEPCQRCNP